MLASRTLQRYRSEPDGTERHAYRIAYRAALARLIADGREELAARRHLERHPELVPLTKPARRTEPSMPKYFTLAQAAAQLGISAGTLNVQARNGKLRAVKPGTDWLVTDAEIARYRATSLGRQRNGATAESETPERGAKSQNGAGKSETPERFGAPRPAPKPRKSETHRSTVR